MSTLYIDFSDLNTIFELVTKLICYTHSTSHPDLGYILVHIFAHVRQLPNPNILNACLAHLRATQAEYTNLVSFILILALYSCLRFLHLLRS